MTHLPVCPMLIPKGKLRISHLEKSIAETRKELKKSDREGQRVDKERSTLQKAVDDLKKKIKALGCDGENTARLRTQLQEDESAIEGLKHIVETLSAQLEGRLAFEYKDPEKNFDHTRVKGLVAKLVTLKDPTTATAVEVVAGSKLYQVMTYSSSCCGQASCADLDGTQIHIT